MGNSIHLDGAEDVRSASHTMSSAADAMRSAANTFSAAVDAHRDLEWAITQRQDRHADVMEQWLVRFEAAIAKLEEVKS